MWWQWSETTHPTQCLASRECSVQGHYHIAGALPLLPSPAPPSHTAGQQETNPLPLVGPYLQNSCPFDSLKPGYFSSWQEGGQWECHFYTGLAPDPLSIQPFPTVADNVVGSIISHCPCASMDCKLRAGRDHAFPPLMHLHRPSGDQGLTAVPMNIQLFVDLTVTNV